MGLMTERFTGLAVPDQPLVQCRQVAIPVGLNQALDHSAEHRCARIHPLLDEAVRLQLLSTLRGKFLLELRMCALATQGVTERALRVAGERCQVAEASSLYEWEGWNKLGGEQPHATHRRL